jgi:hypothetical protein
MTLGIAHRDGERTFLDVLREIKPPFDPVDAVADFARVLISRRIRAVTGDSYGAEWVRTAFRQHGISYIASELNSSQIYLEALPLFTSGNAVLPDDNRLITQLADLERSAGRSARDAVRHPRGRHDDLAVACCGALVQAASARVSRPRRPIEIDKSYEPGAVFKQARRTYLA